MSDQDKPTGKWTAEIIEHVREIKTGDAQIYRFPKTTGALVLSAIVDKHNAALAVRQQHIDNLDAALAAEREDAAKRSHELFDANKQIQQLSEQLAAEREEVQHLRKQLSAAVINGNKTLEREWKLREQLDAELEKVQPIMDALGEIVATDGLEAHGIAERALAKVKEGK